MSLNKVQSLTNDTMSRYMLSNNNNCSRNNNTRAMHTETPVSKSIVSRKENGKKKINQYIVIKDIGKGSFGKVKLVLNSDEDNKPCAMKVLSKRKLQRIFISKSRTALNDVMQEIAIMKKLVSPFTLIMGGVGS